MELQYLEQYKQTLEAMTKNESLFSKNITKKRVLCFTTKTKPNIFEMGHLYYKMLHRNVSIDKCRDFLKVILKEVAQIDVERVPLKNLAATMFAKMETLSKTYVQEEFIKKQVKCFAY